MRVVAPDGSVTAGSQVLAVIVGLLVIAAILAIPGYGYWRAQQALERRFTAEQKARLRRRELTFILLALVAGAAVYTLTQHG